MHLSIKKIIFISLSFILLFITLPLSTYAKDTTENTAYNAIILDNANLFSQSEEAEILEIMKQSLGFGNMLLLTTDEEKSISTYRMADDTYVSQFGFSDGVIFVIDMDERILWLTGEEDLSYVLTNSYCETITDNIYVHAKNANYYESAKTCFEQVNSLLVGKYVPKPMKHISNILLSVLLALLINFFVAMSLNKKSKAGSSAWVNNIISHCNISDTNAHFIRETRVKRSSDSGSGSHSGGHSHSSGGGHSSSGGGHRF